MPQRVQMSRKKGWRKPEGAIYVGRPSKYGNPFAVTNCFAVHIQGRHYHVYREPHVWLSAHTTKAEAIKEAFRRYIDSIADDPLHLAWAGMVVDELGGRDLACWCPLPEPGEPDICHASVLIDIANGGAA